MKFDDWFHEVIYDELDKKGKIHFNNIRTIINEKGKTRNKKEVVKALLSTHLKKMVEQKILEKREGPDKWHGYYEFTKSVQLLRKIGIFEGVKGERGDYDFDESKNPNRVLKKILRKTLYAKGVGVKEDHSFSNQDIIENKPGFTNIMFSSKVKLNYDDVEKIVRFCDEQLRISDPAVFQDSGFDRIEFNKTRKIIKNYLTICAEISAYIIVRLQPTWTHIRKHTNPELWWYSETLGQDKLLYFLEYEMKKRQKDTKKLIQNKTNLKKEFYNEVKRRISVWDHLIVSRQKKLDDLLENMGEKYYTICSLINDFSYPKFMRDLHTSQEI